MFLENRSERGFDTPFEKDFYVEKSFYIKDVYVEKKMGLFFLNLKDGIDTNVWI